jgi:hypothetical protein
MGYKEPIYQNLGQHYGKINIVRRARDDHAGCPRGEYTNATVRGPRSLASEEVFGL